MGRSVLLDIRKCVFITFSAAFENKRGFEIRRALRVTGVVSLNRLEELEGCPFDRRMAVVWCITRNWRGPAEEKNAPRKIMFPARV